MLQVILYGGVAVGVAVVIFLLATRFLPAGEQIAPPLRDEPIWALPADRRLAADDVDGVRLPVALRGYRFAETDTLLDRLAGELRQRDEEIARLRGTAQRPLPPAAEPPAAEPLAAEPPSLGAEPAAEPPAVGEQPTPADDGADEHS